MSLDLSKRSTLAALAPRREPYWSRLMQGLFVGYRSAVLGQGTWIARRRMEDGTQKYHALGPVRDLDEAARAARVWSVSIDAGVTPQSTTVKAACAHYVAHLRLANGAASAADAEGRFRRLVDASNFGAIDLSRLRTSDVKSWVSKQVPLDDADDEDGDVLRRAKDSANRNLASLKAALNLAMRDRLVASDVGWKTVLPFKDVGRRRLGFVTFEQRTALLRHCPADLATLVKALLLTGGRPGELVKVTAQDFSAEQGTLALTGKTGHRVVTVSTTARRFFEGLAKNKIGGAYLLTTEFGNAWNKDSWKKPFRLAVKESGLPPHIVLYSLRHTAISELISGGMDAFTVAKLAGTSTAMIDKHYGHLRHDTTRARLDGVVMIGN
jgi:integrase